MSARSASFPSTKNVECELLTPVGLRTLESADPDYKPRYEGSPDQRDGAYHQGTVWPWLLGPFIDAYLAAFGKTAGNLSHCRGLVEALERHAAAEGCIGSIAEIYDAEAIRSHMVYEKNRDHRIDQLNELESIGDWQRVILKAQQGGPMPYRGLPIAER